MNGRKKVTVVGAGNVGATCALEVARSDYADVVVVDIVPNFAAGKALDMNQMASVTGYEPTVVGSEDYAATKGSDVVVITAGRPRSPGMSRDDRDDERGDRRLGHEGGRAPLAEERDHRRLEPARRDVPRRARGLGLPEGARVRDGGHPRHGPVLRVHRVGDGLVGEGRAGDGARRARRPDGPGRVRDDRRRRPARAAHDEGEDLEDGRADAKGRRELVGLLGTSAWYAPGAAAAQMVDAVCLDQKRVLPCTALLGRRPLHGRPGAARRRAGSRRS